MLENGGDATKDVSQAYIESILIQLKATTNGQQKMLLWEQLTTAVFSRCCTLILATSYLTVLTCIQLSIFAGYTFREMNFTPSQPSKSSKYDDHSAQGTYKPTLTDTSRESFLAEGTKKMIIHGTDEIGQKLRKEIIPEIMKSFELSRVLTLSELSELLTTILKRFLSSGW